MDIHCYRNNRAQLSDTSSHIVTSTFVWLISKKCFVSWHILPPTAEIPLTLTGRAVLFFSLLSPVPSPVILVSLLFSLEKGEKAIALPDELLEFNQLGANFQDIPLNSLPWSEKKYIFTRNFRIRLHPLIASMTRLNSASRIVVSIEESLESRSMHSPRATRNSLEEKVMFFYESESPQIYLLKKKRKIPCHFPFQNEREWRRDPKVFLEHIFWQWLLEWRNQAGSFQENLRESWFAENGQVRFWVGKKIFWLSPLHIVAGAIGSLSTGPSNPKAFPQFLRVAVVKNFRQDFRRQQKHVPGFGSANVAFQTLSWFHCRRPESNQAQGHFFQMTKILPKSLFFLRQKSQPIILRGREARKLQGELFREMGYSEKWTWEFQRSGSDLLCSHRLQSRLQVRVLLDALFEENIVFSKKRVTGCQIVPSQS